MSTNTENNLVTVAGMSEGQNVTSNLWLVSAAVRKTKGGDPYVECRFQDATGSISAKLWDSHGQEKRRVSNFSGKLIADRPFRVEGRVDSYNSDLQLTIISCDQLEQGTFDPSCFSPRSARGTEEMVEEFDGLVSKVKDPDYRKLLLSLRGDAEQFGRFTAAPAAKFIHHAWIGGLIEHSLSICRSAMALCANYPELDRDLLVTGAFFHDIGKVLEISSDPGFEYTADGRLLGHIYSGARLAEKYMGDDFPPEKRRLLVHLILSHQGDRSEGFGSPVDPSTPEAIFFHHLDNLDAKLQNCLTALAKDVPPGEFSDARANALKRSYYKAKPDMKDSGGASPSQKPQKKGSKDAGQHTSPGLFAGGDPAEGK